MHKSVVAAFAAILIVAAAGTASAEESCSGAGSGAALSKASVEAKLKSSGYTTIRELKSHNGCYEAKGLDRKGKRFEVEVNAHTGEITKRE